MAKHIPAEFVGRANVRVIVGCTSESASKVYFSADDAVKEVGDHTYLAFFDEAGDKIDEVMVVLSDDGEVLVEDNF